MNPTTSFLVLVPLVLLLAAGVVFYLSGDGYFRYPCQDPANFADPSCQRPACVAAEVCTDMLINLGETE
jgi:hypothetical protein